MTLIKGRLAGAAIAAFLAPALLAPFPVLAGEDPAPETFPQVRIGGYTEFVTMFNRPNRALLFGSPDYANQALLAVSDRFNPHLGQVRFNFNYRLAEEIDGISEINLFPAWDAGFYVANYLDIVGNGAGVVPAGLVGPSVIPGLGFSAGRVQISYSGLLGQRLTVGQMRVPFGLWDEFSIHRPNFIAKNNTRVLGVLLRRLDLGAVIEGDLVDGGLLNYRLGAMGRGSDPTRDYNDRQDAVIRLGSRGLVGDLGLNAYVPDTKDSDLGKKGAVGVDLSVPLPGEFDLVGEYVRQFNSNADQDGSRWGLGNAGVADGLYARITRDLSDWVPGMRVFGGFEVFNIQAAADPCNPPGFEHQQGSRSTPTYLTAFGPASAPAAGHYSTLAAKPADCGIRNAIDVLQRVHFPAGNEWKVLTGARWRFVRGSTLGLDYTYGLPAFDYGHVHLRLETLF